MILMSKDEIDDEYLDEDNVNEEKDNKETIPKDRALIWGMFIELS